MRLVAQPLHEVEHRVARPKLDRLPARNEERLPPGIALRPLGDANQWHVGHADRGEHLLRRIELTEPSIDEEKVRPRRLGSLLGVRLFV